MSSRRSVWSKVGLVILLPILATVVVVGSGLRDGFDAANDIGQVRDLAMVVAASGDLVQNVQDERAAAAIVLGAMTSPRRSQHGADFENAGAAVDDVAGAYATRRAALRDLPAALAATVTRIDDGLRGLAGVRTAVSGGGIAISDAAGAYDALVDNLLRLRDGVADLTSDANLGQRMRAAAAVARQKEYVSQERLVVLQAYAAGALDPSRKNEFVAAQARRRFETLEAFSSVATQAEKQQFDLTVAGPAVRAATAFEGWILGALPADGQLSAAPFRIDTWDGALRGYGRLLGGLEKRFDTAAVDTATDLRDDGRRRLFVETGVPLAMVLLALVVAWLVGRSLAREPHGGAVGPDSPVEPDRPLATTRSGGGGAG